MRQASLLPTYLGMPPPTPDLLLSGGNSVSLAAANGDGTYKAPVLITDQAYPAVGTVTGFRVADVNGDGLPDLLVIGEGSSDHVAR